jgi:hypothetical protein
LRRLQNICSAATLSRAAVIALVGILGAAGPAAASPILNVAGSTLGCFGDGCSGFGSPVSVSDEDYELTFSGTSFAATTDLTGSVSSFSLGMMTRGGTNTDENVSELPFTLQVTFTLPSGIDGGQGDTFTALITGTSANGGGGPLPIDFNNDWQTFTFSNASGSGSFLFAVINDPAVTKNTTRNGNGALILGGIQNASFTPASSTGSESINVPEPASMLLMGLSACALAIRKRRQQAAKRG